MVQLVEDLAEVVVGVDMIEATRECDAVGACSTLASRLIVNEEIIFASEGHGFPEPFEGIAVDGESPIAETTMEPWPTVQKIGAGHAQGMFGSGVLAELLNDVVELVEYRRGFLVQAFVIAVRISDNGP